MPFGEVEEEISFKKKKMVFFFSPQIIIQQHNLEGFIPQSVYIYKTPAIPPPKY